MKKNSPFYFCQALNKLYFYLSFSLSERIDGIYIIYKKKKV
jgi:hypothetical protein